MLRRLRRQSTDYQIPRGGWFERVSAPHYLGEILEWIGFALATRTKGAWMFVLFTSANLIPRGVSHHLWYQEHFKDYPKDRKAVIPWVW